MNGEPPTNDVSLPVAGGRSLRAALALPRGEGAHPGMIVLHEAFGLNDDIRRITRRFATEGYAALAPDLYSFGNRALCLTRVVMESMIWNGKGALDHIEETRRYLAARPDVDAEKIGVVGFCMGGGFALAFATKGRVGAAGVNYGAVPRDRGRLQGACPVVASYGGLDKLFASHATRLRVYLESLGIPHDVNVYPDSGHSFLSYDNKPAWMQRIPLPDPMHVEYNERDAADAWERMLTFFADHLGVKRE